MKKSEALKTLGLSDGATDDEVKQAHRKLVISHHPDKFALDSPERAEAEEFTKRINEARDVLLNRSWTPEFDPRRDPRPYAGNPYAPSDGRTPTAARGQDPFARLAGSTRGAV
ncbi:J domain-containing protein, partial [Eggerthella sinensis]|uniref:J domain-containing protein n=1 Tax=Eggerthella sinensis TaxID=242230 RepID=UPI0022E86A65